MNRRGVAYTVVAVILLIATASLFFAQSQRSAHEKHAAVAERIRAVDAFIDNFEADSRRAAYIAGFRSMIAMEQHMTTSGEYLSDPEETFKILFTTGNISAIHYIIMDNSSFNEYLDKVRVEARGQGVIFNATLKNLSLWQANPWSLLVNYTLTLNISDVRGTARWDTIQTFTGSVPIEDLRDPLYSVETLARVQHVIKRTNVSGFVNDIGNANDTSGLIAHYNNSFYAAHGRGPDILMRFAGDFSNSPYGIESLVDTQELFAQDLDVHASATIVDYKYFQALGADACNFVGDPDVPDRVKLALDDLDVYGIEGALEYDSC